MDVGGDGGRDLGMEFLWDTLLSDVAGGGTVALDLAELTVVDPFESDENAVVGAPEGRGGLAVSRQVLRGRAKASRRLPSRR